ncbi:hypothetical protein JE959_001743 [Aeromonas veronii]|nr:hypothetical protein [Aeromonas veronii]
MKVIVKESSSVEELLLINPESGVDDAQEFLSDAGVFSDGQFNWVEKLGAYVCELTTFKKWSGVVAEYQLMGNRLYALAQEHGKEIIFELVSEAMNAPLEEVPARVGGVLDEAFAGDTVIVLFRGEQRILKKQGAVILHKDKG